MERRGKLNEGSKSLHDLNLKGQVLSSNDGEEGIKKEARSKERQPDFLRACNPRVWQKSMD